MSKHTLSALSISALRALFAAAAAAALVSCGGGGGSSGATELPTVTSSTAASVQLGLPVLVTINGTRLDLGLTVTSTGCTGMARSTTAPNVSSATTAYYTCTASVEGAQTVAIARSIDGINLSTAAYTVSPAAAAQPTVANTAVGAVKYSQQVLVTVTGTALDGGLAVVSPGCKNMTLSTTAPNVSTATTAYYTCTASVVGAQSVSVVRAVDSVSLFSAPFTVPVPQVTMTVANAPGTVAGSMVITLAPDKTPVTVDNFLAYVNSGFYNGTIFHRVVNGFVVQGGGFLPITVLPAVQKSGLSAPIALEVNKGLSNTQWTIAMARTSAADSATSQFFINLANNAASLDPGPTPGYAVFGSVTTNTALVSAIVGAPCAPIAGFSECAPNPNMTISAATQTQ